MYREEPKKPERTNKNPRVTHLADEAVPPARIAKPNEGHPFLPKDVSDEPPAPPEKS